MNCSGRKGLFSAGWGSWVPPGFLILISTTTVFAQGFGHGTAVAVYRSPEGLLAAVDSKEVYTEYRDGIASTDDRVACKVTRVGPWFAIVSGLVTGSSGFDALRDAQSAWQSGDSFHEASAHVRDTLSIRLTHLITALAELNISNFSGLYLNRVILQIAVFGVEAGVPRVEVIEFQAKRSAPDRFAVSATSQECPGDCASDRFVYLLGAHEAMEKFLRNNPAIIRQLNAKRIEGLIGLAYEERPDIVGGPISLIAIDKTGKATIREGACPLFTRVAPLSGSDTRPGGVPILPSFPRVIGENPATAVAFAPITAGRSVPDDSRMVHPWTPAQRIQADLERKLAELSHVWCHEKIFRYSRWGDSERTFEAIDADIEMVDGVEKFTSISSGRKTWRALSDTGGAWSSGEIAAILRTSRDVILSELGAVTAITAEDGGETDVLRFQHTSPDALWTIGIGPHTYPMGFEGTIHLSHSTGEVRQIQWRAANPPSHIAAIEWTVNFGAAQVAGKNSTAPIASTYSVAYKGPNRRVDRNEKVFSDFRGYGSETTIRYQSEESGIAH
jgi:hypothetical protein